MDPEDLTPSGMPEPAKRVVSDSNPDVIAALEEFRKIGRGNAGQFARNDTSIKTAVGTLAQSIILLARGQHDSAEILAREVLDHVDELDAGTRKKRKARES